jgi:hypothetical protein
MTRIPPSITKVFKRIAPTKSAPDRQKTTTTGQLASPQKTVRFADDQPVAHQQRRANRQADPHMDSLSGGSGQDMRTSSKRRDAKAETYPQVPTIIKKEIEDDSSESSSEESLQETPPKSHVSLPDPGIKRKFPAQYNAIESDLDAYFNNLEKDNLYSSLETKTNNTNNTGVNLNNNYSPSSHKNQDTSGLLRPSEATINSKTKTNTLDIISDEIDSYLNDLEKNNLYDSSSHLTEQKHDVNSDIHLRRITEKNV